MNDKNRILQRLNKLISIENPLLYTIKKIYDEKLDSNLKQIISSSTNMSSKQKSNKMQLFYNAKLRNINTTITEIEEPKTRKRMNYSVKILRTENSENEELNRFQTLNQKNQSIKRQRRLRLRISVINQMMMCSEEQIEEKCIEIFRKLAKPINNVPILEVKRLQTYLQSIFKNEKIVSKTIRYLSVPQSMNYKNYCNLIQGFNDWTKQDILFFCFYVFQQDYHAFLDSDTLFSLITSEQCFSDDANFIFKTLKDREQLNCRSNYRNYFTRLLKLPNLTYRKYKQEASVFNEQIRKSKLEVYQIRTKEMFSGDLQSLEKEEQIYEMPGAKEDEIIVTFETFRNIYNRSHPCFFGWLLKCLADMDIHFIGQKLIL